MEFIQSSEDVMGIKTSRWAIARSRNVVSASVLALILACAAQPEPAFAQFNVGGLVGGLVGGALGGARGYNRGYGYAPRSGGRRSYAGRHQERHVAKNRTAPREEENSAPAAVASAPAASAPSPTVAPAAEHTAPGGPGNGSLH